MIHLILYSDNLIKKTTQSESKTTIKTNILSNVNS
jgi:hypothetical protein